MKTLNQVLGEAQEFEKPLIRAVYRRIGRDFIQDVCNNGISGGFSGFTYYTDTSNFFRKHRAAICQMAKNLAEEVGVEMLVMIKDFRCLSGVFSETDIGQVIFGKWDNLDNIKFPRISNAMAWFAAGEICRRFEE